jgi:alpha-1,2-mannosyltransferase
VLIGLAAAVKLTPLIFIPMLWCGGRRRAAVTAAATFLSCGAAAWVLLPAESWRFWATEVRNVDRLGYITSVGNQSLNAALLRWGADDTARSGAVLLLGGLIVLLSLRRAAKLARAGNWPAATIVVGAAGIVFSPVSWTHHQVWLVVAAFLPIHRAYRWAILAVMLLPVTALGPPLWSNARLLLAVAAAALLPIRTDVTRTAEPARRRPAPARGGAP